MKCKNCPAYGIDNLNFSGCLIKHTMLTFPSGDSGCRYQYKNILKSIDIVKKQNLEMNFTSGEMMYEYK